ILTPRKSNIADFQALGCRTAIWTPFGFDPSLFPEPHGALLGSRGVDVLFVGGADPDRASFFTKFMREGPKPALVGGYWERFPALRALAVGQKGAAELASMTAAATINLCLVRRANRDGHVMRSFEIPAAGGFMIAEDTNEHRELFGPEGECTL